MRLLQVAGYEFWNNVAQTRIPLPIAKKACNKVTLPDLERYTPVWKIS